MNSPLVQSMLNQAKYAFLPGAQIGINRVRHDREFNGLRGPGKYPYLSRFYDNKLSRPRGLPETVRFYGGRSTTILAPQWQQWFYEANAENPAAYQYLKRLQSGWVNYGPWPKIEQLCFGGDYVVVTGFIGDYCLVESYDNALKPSDYVVDYLQAFGVVYSDDTIGPPPCGPAYTMAIHNHGEQFRIHKSNLTFIRRA